MHQLVETALGGRASGRNWGFALNCWSHICHSMVICTQPVAGPCLLLWHTHTPSSQAKWRLSHTQVGWPFACLCPAVHAPATATSPGLEARAHQG